MRLRLAPDNPQIAVAEPPLGTYFGASRSSPQLLYDVFTAPNGFSVSAIAVANEGTFYVANSANGMGAITRFTCLLGCTTENMWPQAQNPPAGVCDRGRHRSAGD